MLLHATSKYKEKHKPPTPPDAKPKRRKGRFWRRLARVLVVFFATLVIIYLILPGVLVFYLNKKWASMPGYVGHLEAIEINLADFSVTAKQITIKKKNGKIADPFIYVSQSNVSVDWEAWDKGTRAASIVLDSIGVNIYKAQSPELSQTPSDTAIFNLVDVMMPIDRNRLEIKRGTIKFHDTHTGNPFSIELNRLHVLATNLENADKLQSPLPATVKISANAYGGQLNLHLRANPKSEKKDFELTANLSRLPLPNVNHLLLQFAKFDVNRGFFTLKANIAAQNNQLRGLVDLEIAELDVFDRKLEKEKSAKEKNRERWIEFFGKLVTNKEDRLISTKVEIEGNLNNPKISIWQIIAQAITESGTKSLSKGFDKSEKVDEDGERKPSVLERLFDKDVRNEMKAKRQQKREEKKKEREEKKKK